MLFDLYENNSDGSSYEYWIKRVHFVAQVLGYDYFKLWDLNEVEFKILENQADEEVSRRKERLEEAKNNK